MVQLEIGRIGLYAAQDELVDLASYFKRDGEKIEDFIPGLMNYSYYDNKLIALPHGRSTPLFYYNKDLFKKAGLDPEKAPATWDELASYAQKLTADGVYGFSVPIDTWYYLSMVMAAGGDLFNKEGNNIGFNNESGAKPLRLWLDLIQKGYMHVPPGQEYNSSEACRANFSAGKVAMMMQSTGSLIELINASNFEVGVGFMPKETRYAVPPGGANYLLMMGHPKEKEEAAWQFLKWVTNTQNSAYWSINTGYFPTRYSALETQTFKDYVAKYPNAKISVDQLQYADFPSPFQPEWAEIKDVIVNNEIQRCILDPAITPEMAVQRIYDASAKLFGK
jgi:sn-glycerol 3-phosphate transport system substrate-binding protein